MNPLKLYKYYPSKELAIDESLILWKGRLSFRQYLKGKAHQYGIKLYVLADAILKMWHYIKNSYLCRFTRPTSRWKEPCAKSCYVAYAKIF